MPPAFGRRQRCGFLSWANVSDFSGVEVWCRVSGRHCCLLGLRRVAVAPRLWPAAAAGGLCRARFSPACRLQYPSTQQQSLSPSIGRQGRNELMGQTARLPSLAITEDICRFGLVSVAGGHCLGVLRLSFSTGGRAQAGCGHSTRCGFHNPGTASLVTVLRAAPTRDVGGNRPSAIHARIGSNLGRRFRTENELSFYRRVGAGQGSDRDGRLASAMGIDAFGAPGRDGLGLGGGAPIALLHAPSGRRSPEDGDCEVDQGQRRALTAEGRMRIVIVARGIEPPRSTPINSGQR